MNEQTETAKPVDTVVGEVKEPKKKDAPKPTDIVVREGALAPQTSSELMRTISNIAAGGGFPECFDTPAKQIAAYNLAHSLMGGRWQLALNNMAPIKGKLTIWGELPGAVAEQTKEVAEKKVFCIDKDYKPISLENKNLLAEPFAGVCIIQRKGREKKEFFYTMADAIHAGQYPAKRRDGSLNADSPWNKFTKVMLMRKAMAMAIKFEFADAMVGVPVAEYDMDEAPDLTGMKDVSEVSEKTNRVRDLNNRFSDEAGPAEAVQ